MPKVSVIMPAYNAEKYIKEAIDSILNQTFKDFEFIIIDDCSSDNTFSIVEQFKDKRIKLFKNEQNSGVAKTLNRCLDLASGEYIARMDADDISLPERLEKQVLYMDAHKNCIICGSNSRLFGANEGRTYVPVSDSGIRASLIFSSPFIHPTVIMRKNFLADNDLKYNPIYEGIEDYELWFRLSCLKGDLHNLDDLLLNYRLHSLQVTQKKVDENRRRISVEFIQKVFSEYGLGDIYKYPLFLELFDSFEFKEFNIIRASEYFSELKSILKNCSDYLKKEMHSICNAKVISVLLVMHDRRTIIKLACKNRDLLTLKDFVKIFIYIVKGNKR